MEAKYSGLVKKICDTILDAIGETPLVRINRITKGVVNGTVLSISGTAGADQILMAQDANFIYLSNNGVAEQFPIGSLTSIFSDFSFSKHESTSAVVST